VLLNPELKDFPKLNDVVLIDYNGLMGQLQK
jgi:hypothetical protein